MQVLSDFQAEQQEIQKIDWRTPVFPVQIQVEYK
jgi:hypothetical protein